MKILLTNDDGINSEGIQKLAGALRSKGKYKVTVIAPEGNRSGISHAVSLLNGPVKLSRLDADTFSCSGYPADCVIAALLGALTDKPDLLLSGINHGVNLGTDIIYSGTVAAARQASLAGIPAIALSLAGSAAFCWDMAASWAADHLEELMAYCEKDTFVNVNIPNNPEGPDGIAVTYPAAKRYNDTLSVMNAPDGSLWCFLNSGEEAVVTDAGSDCAAVSRNLVSVSSVCNLPAIKRAPGAADAGVFAPASCRGGEKG